MKGEVKGERMKAKGRRRKDEVEAPAQGRVFAYTSKDTPILKKDIPISQKDILILQKDIPIFEKDTPILQKDIPIF